MAITKDKVNEVLALPVEDRAYLVRQLIESLYQETDPGAEDAWAAEIDRRSEEIEKNAVECRPLNDSIQDIRAELKARRQSS